jgi:hypothetical protein
MRGKLAVLLNRSQGLSVISFIFKAAFIRRPGPDNSDKTHRNDGKKDYRDKQISASELHICTFKIIQRIPKKTGQNNTPAI